jgi:cytochrome c peroxidase
MAMKKALFGLLLVLAACGSDSGGPEPQAPRDPFFTEAEWAQIQTLSPLPPLPPSPTNRYADAVAAAALGQKLFFDPRFSGPLRNPDNALPGGNGPVGASGQVSCASCHRGADLFVDTRSRPNNVSLGLDWGPRNTPSVLNAAFFDFVLWDGRADSLWMQAIRPLTLHPEQGVTLLGLAHVIADHYAGDYAAVFGALPALSDTARFPLTGGPEVPETGAPATATWQAMTAEDQTAVRRVAANFGKAIEAYERKLVSGNAKFDRYVAGQHELFAESEKRGLRVFLGVAGCMRCHSGPMFTDQQFHNLGLRQAGGPHVPARDGGAGEALPLLLADPFNGAGAFSDDPAAGTAHLQRLQALAPQPGQFRTATLRNIGDNNRPGTGPYFHNGSQTGLTGVIEFYRRGGDPAGTFVGTKDPKIQPIPPDGFQPTQVFDLQGFLWTLSGEPLDPSLTTAPPLPP